MTTIGMLHYRKYPQKVFKTYAYAAAAKMEGVDFFYFSPSKIDLEKKLIKGLFYYKNGEWVEREVGYPDIVLNTGGTLTSKQDAIVDALQQDVPFTSHSIGDKIAVYNRIKKSGHFTQYLIPSEELKGIQTMFLYLDTYKSIIIKPAYGAKGEGVIFLEKKDSNFLVKNLESEHHFFREDLENFMDELLLQNETYLVQPFIQSITQQGLPFDFRLHVQKDGQGKWVLTTMYPRIANKGVISNLSSGGYTSISTKFLNEQFSKEYYNVKRYLEVFAIQFANHFDSLYEDPLDELGIDVGIDENRKIWIYEVNWRPGPPVLFYLEIDAAKRAIEYAVYLAQTNQISHNRIT
jgi:hypothetical protein